MSAIQRWKSMVEAEHAQSERMRRHEPPPIDHWRPYAQQFRVDPRRTDDLLVNRLIREVQAHQTLLDVGAGGGRLSLPLALNCRHVAAVEPSSSMAEVLRQQASDSSIQNVSLVRAKWEDAEVEAADIVLCCHVLYVVTDIERFVRKLEYNARQSVLVVLYNSAPQSQTYPLWKQIHGEDRLHLPSLPEFQEVLCELDIDARVEILPPQKPRGFDYREQALEQLGRRLYLKPDGRQMAELESMLPDLLEEVEGTLVIRGSQPLEPGLVIWRPKGTQN
jgi:SAM-dependent methyltransferase